MNRMTAETITDEQIRELRDSHRAPHGDIGDVAYYAELAQQTIPAVRSAARCWLAAAWNSQRR